MLWSFFSVSIPFSCDFCTFPARLALHFANLVICDACAIPLYDAYLVDCDNGPLSLEAKSVHVVEGYVLDVVVYK